MTTASRCLDELCHLTAQSLVSLETTEHFKIIKLLGEGSYGQVKLAVHKKRGTPMALKFFPRESTGLLSFLREYNLSLAFCSHPSLTSALGIAFSTPTHYVFAQQPSLYGDLFDVIVPDEGVDEDCAQRVTSQISGALAHLHRLGFVHRDLKPENIFLCDRECRWVKLGDFGMAKAQGVKAPCVWYSSPYCTPEAEIARDTDPLPSDADAPLDENGNPVEVKKKKHVMAMVEASTDTWALGMLIYALLTGMTPWGETSSDNLGYVRFKEWAERANEHPREVNDTNDDCDDGQNNSDGNNNNNNKNDNNNVAPQFTRFTSLACSLFLLLLDPQPARRGSAQEVEGFLGRTWLRDGDRRQREEAAANRKQREIMDTGKETERAESRDR
ncbi:serine/threonine-protein kinase SBK1 [Sardina pilchardus]|uniref:serine/threonine-protein kinase SBK1 n=1 Tax=Sardina pilchardus TaxID=27697 RepID=UPI002E11E1E5